MGKKKTQVLAIGQCIETVVEHLTDLGYVYLGDSEFKPRQSIEKTMSKRPYMCYHMLSRRINLRTIEEIDIWNPTGKVFCELIFDYEGLSGTSSITIGKNQYNGEKAIKLIEKNIFTK